MSSRAAVGALRNHRLLRLPPAGRRPNVEPIAAISGAALPHALSRAALLTGLAAGALAAAAAPPLAHARCSAAPGSSAAAAASNSATPSTAEQFALLRVAGDGRCMFRALAQGAHLAAAADAAGGEAPAEPWLLPGQHEEERADALRHAVCEELLARRGEVECFIDGDFDAYVANMRGRHVWGGEPELAMAAHVLHRPITVYSLQPSLHLVSQYGDEYGDGRSAVPLLFHRAGHYDLLVRQPLPQSKL